MILGLLISIGSSFLSNGSIICHFLKLNTQPNSLQLGGQFIVLFQILILDHLTLILDGILGIVQGSDMEDKLLVDVCAELVWFV